MGTPKKLLNIVRLSGDNFDLIRFVSQIKIITIFIRIIKCNIKYNLKNGVIYLGEFNTYSLLEKNS